MEYLEIKAIDKKVILNAHTHNIHTYTYRG